MTQTTVPADPSTTPAPWSARVARLTEPERLGRFVERVVAGPGAQQHTSVSPVTGQPLVTLPHSSREDVAEAVERARRAQVKWARTAMRDRSAILLRFHDLCLERQGELMDAVQLESGKARRHAFEEVADCALCARHYARRAAAYLKEHRRPGAFPVLSQARELHHPKGVVGVVSPWNYPLSLAITDALPALMAGNAVVMRPDPQTSLSALLAHDLLVEAGLPPSVLQVVLGPGETAGDAVVELADYVCYTGSTPTGRAVGAKAAQRLVGFSLELGGKNAMYVRADADVAHAVEGMVRGCFSSAGQLCISAERVLVHRDVADRFVPAFVAAVRSMRLGNALEFGYDMGSLIGRRQLDRVSAHVEDARAKGATVLVGGQARPDLGPWFYEPTVLQDVTPEMACRDEETFGPVVSLYVVDSDDEAVELANDTDYGLNAAIFTRDVRAGRELAARIRTGTVNINEAYAAAWASMGAPMGGMKASGIGRRHGAEGILKYTEAQNVTAQHLLGFGPVLGMSDEAHATFLTLALRGMKAAGLR